MRGAPRAGWLLITAVVIAAGLCAGAITTLGLASDDPGLGVRTTMTPEGMRVPLSRSVDPTSLAYRGRLGDAAVYLAEGAGPTAGMRCVVLATETLTRTACDTPARVESSGLVLSEDAGPGLLTVSGYLPGGVATDLTGPVRSRGELFERVVGTDQRTITVQHRGSAFELAVPGSR